MRLRALAVFPFLFAVVFIVITLILDGPPRASFLVGQKLLLRALAIFGCWWAASVFEKGDRLRRAWILLVTATVLVLLRDILRLTERYGLQGPQASSFLLPGLALASNLALLAGVFLLSRAWRVAAAMGAADRRKEALITLFTALLAIAVAGPAALQAARALGAGDSQAVVALASAVCDILSLSLIAPLFLIALQMSGGLLSWPWGLLAASLLAWLLYDAAAMVGPVWTPGFPLHEVFRGLAENFLFAAGCAQALVIGRVRRR
jgi:putative effector of murein hydrolase